eukprot:1115725_1
MAELCVYGYTRIVGETLAIPLPTSIQRLCLLMYSNLDQWNAEVCNPFKKEFIFDMENGLLTLTSNNTGNWINAFGRDIITKGQQKLWTFLIGDSRETRSFALNAAIVITWNLISQNVIINAKYDHFCISKDI